MSKKHPVIAVTGSSGAGTTTVKNAFEHIFRREGIKPAVVEGDSFHKFDRASMKAAVEVARKEGRTLSHIGADANLFDKLEELFRTYGETGGGEKRYYIHNEEEAAQRGAAPGTFTPWETIPASALLFYEGLHGGVVADGVDVAQWVDLLIGVVPIVNLEWIQKIHRDNKERGYSAEAIVGTILRRMPDYVQFITPQFSRTVINFLYPKKHDIPYYLQMSECSWMSRPNTIVVPGGKMGFAMEVILTPIIHDMMEHKRKLST